MSSNMVLWRVLGCTLLYCALSAPVMSAVNPDRLKVVGGYAVPQGIYTKGGTGAGIANSTNVDCYYNTSGSILLTLGLNNGAAPTMPGWPATFQAMSKPWICWYIWDAVVSSFTPYLDQPSRQRSHAVYGAAYQGPGYGDNSYQWYGYTVHNTNAYQAIACPFNYPVTVTLEVVEDHPVPIYDYNGVHEFTINEGKARGHWVLQNQITELSNIDPLHSDIKSYGMYDSEQDKWLVWDPVQNRWAISDSEWSAIDAAFGGDGWDCDYRYGVGVGGTISEPNQMFWDQGVTSNFISEIGWVVTSNGWTSGNTTAGYLSYQYATNYVPPSPVNVGLPGQTNVSGGVLSFSRAVNMDEKPLWYEAPSSRLLNMDEKPLWYVEPIAGAGGSTSAAVDLSGLTNLTLDILPIVSGLSNVNDRVQNLLDNTTGTLERLLGSGSGFTNDLGFSDTNPYVSFSSDISNHYAQLFIQATNQWEHDITTVSSFWHKLTPLSDAKLTTISLPFAFGPFSKTFVLDLGTFDVPLGYWYSFCQFFIWTITSIAVVRIYMGE